MERLRVRRDGEGRWTGAVGSGVEITPIRDELGRVVRAVYTFADETMREAEFQRDEFGRTASMSWSSPKRHPKSCLPRWSHRMSIDRRRLRSKLGNQPRCKRSTFKRRKLGHPTIPGRSAMRAHFNDLMSGSMSPD